MSRSWVVPTAVEQLAARRRLDASSYCHSPDLEFGLELQLFVPFMYGLYRAGFTPTIVSRFPKVLFYFGNHREPDELPHAPHARHYHFAPYPLQWRRVYRWLSYRGVIKWRFWRPKDYARLIAGDMPYWCPPPYRSAFRNDRFVFGKDILVVQNKYTTEPYIYRSLTGRRRHAPYNFIPLDALDEIFHELKGRYQIIYNRFTTTIDRSVVQDLGDFDLIRRRHPEVLTIQDLAERTGRGYNEVQLQVYANAERFIGVQGGGSVLLHHFGGKCVVFHRLPPDSYDKILNGQMLLRGQVELQYRRNCYEELFPRFSGQEIVPKYDLESFRRSVFELF